MYEYSYSWTLNMSCSWSGSSYYTQLISVKTRTKLWVLSRNVQWPIALANFLVTTMQVSAVTTGLWVACGLRAASVARDLRHSARAHDGECVLLGDAIARVERVLDAARARVCGRLEFAHGHRVLDAPAVLVRAQHRVRVALLWQHVAAHLQVSRPARV